ncbi:aryl-alcohol dehydrogenase-like predicted oxidoreductase [Crossiella equi]|uniref:Aryl-alcohol dehydrogenase-like predicted oxidoreductase n=1 Tax=Crossiella equi TaxID=130796 RepID=A0ABS5ARI3_9PSEU|nr:aldo/keto reductase [Crossiella equi]MBP2479165.1 aryl-alcohol dehydrogenase-like predicted oxidoreductase [Crossiella equi]
MRYEQLGTTGVYVSRIALGTMTFGGADTPPWNVVGGLDQAASGEIIAAALDAGVNLLDTADMYAGGECEEIIGRALGTRREDVLLATKLAARVGPGVNQVGLSRLHLLRSLEDSLRRLRTDRIDLYQVHAFDPLVPLAETLSALDDAVRQGKVRYLGVSNFAAWQLAKALGVSERLGLPRFQATQSYYSLAGRDIEDELVPLLLSEQVGLLVYSPLAGGFLSGKFDRHGNTDEHARRAVADTPPVDLARTYDVIDVLGKVAARHQASVAQVALAWVLAQPAVTSVIVGARRPAQLADNLGALELVLTAEDLTELGEVSATPVRYPHWLPATEDWRHPQS